MKVNKPTWMKGNVIGAFHNGNFWNNNIFEIHVAVYNEDKTVGDKTIQAAIEFKFANDIKLIASLITNQAILQSEAEILEEIEIDYQFLDDDNSIMLKISFDLEKDNINGKIGNHYFIILFENEKALITSLTNNGIIINKV